MAFPYAPPQVIVQAQGARLLASLNSVRPAIVVLGTAPTGPDTPQLIDPVSATSLYGSPVDPGTVGYTLPYLMGMLRAQQPAEGAPKPLAFIACRCGVQRASTQLVHANSTDQVWTLSFLGIAPTGGTFTLSYDDETTDAIDYDATPTSGPPATADNIQTALTALATIGAGNVTVSALSATVFTITATGDLAATLLPTIGVTTASLTPVGVTASVAISVAGAAAGVSMVLRAVGAYAGSVGNTLCAYVSTDEAGEVQELALYDTLGTLVGPAVSQKWRLTFSGVPDEGGTFTLTYGSTTPQTVTYSQTAATTASAIEAALSNAASMDAGNVTVSAINNVTFIITAAGSLVDEALPPITVDATGLIPDTIVGTVVITRRGGLTPGTNWALLQTYRSADTDLRTPQTVAGALNGANAPGNPNAVAVATIVDPSTPLPDAGYYYFAGGGDGKGTASDDPSIAMLLQQSLAYRADYVVAGWDAFDLADTISTHLNDAHNQNQFRCAVLGPKLGTRYSKLVSEDEPYNTYVSSRVILVGHDAVLFPSATTGHLNIFDGFYLAAAVAGLKAVSPPEETCIGWEIGAIAAVALPPDPSIASPLSVAQKDVLAQAGFLVVEPGRSGRPVVRDDLTSALWSVNNAINPFSQWNVQTIDDAVSEALMRAVLPFRGRPMPDLDTARVMLKQACTQAMARLGPTTNGVQSISVDISADTLVPIIDVVYVTRFPFRTILIRTSYVFV